MKWYGTIGFDRPVEKVKGVSDHEFTERQYYGDVITLSSRWQNTEHVNNDLKLNVKISVMADPFIYEFFPYMKYVEYMGHKWCIVEITPNRPRIELMLGGLYNGQ
ncbi:MAG: hypothetical protein J6Y02_16560 [Pseudobutyrivibrio sp.]|nr:hypothetical protein [Pseudobutyrivibrio sp.]